MDPASPLPQWLGYSGSPNGRHSALWPSWPLLGSWRRCIGLDTRRSTGARRSDTDLGCGSDAVSTDAVSTSAVCACRLNAVCACRLKNAVWTNAVWRCRVAGDAQRQASPQNVSLTANCVTGPQNVSLRKNYVASPWGIPIPGFGTGRHPGPPPRPLGGAAGTGPECDSAPEGVGRPGSPGPGPG